MRVLLINSVCGIGSTGRICTDLAQQFEKEGHEVKIAYGRDSYVPEQFQKYAIRVGTDFDVKLHGLRTRLLDEHGFGSIRATRQFLKWAEDYNPDILWLHNLHGYYINIELLFQWIKRRPDMQVKWTLHDCWAFTGHCSHFVAVNCEQWKEQCLDCSQKERYPASRLKDNCKNNYVRKKNAFTGVEDLILVTPSKWLADLTRDSFLKAYPVEVQYNKIDTTIFKPTQSDFREKHGLENRKIILGVASTWTERKGLYDFIKLSKILEEEYIIVLVGLDERQQSELPHNVIGIAGTNNIEELAAIYTAADVFVNLTYEDTFPTVNIEALACGTPVITYATGGAGEMLDTDTGIIVEVGNIQEVINGIKKLLQIEKTVIHRMCLARSKKFSIND